MNPESGLCTQGKGNDTQTSIHQPGPTTQAAPFDGTRSYTYVIQSRDNVPAPRQAPRGCFDHLGDFPSNGCKEQDRNDRAWLPFLEALGLQQNVFPAIKIDGIKPQTGDAGNENNAACWNYLNYVLIAVSPEGKLEGRVMYNLALAWCPVLKANNNSFRHSLTKCDEFRSSKPYHRLAYVTESVKEKRSPTISQASSSPASSTSTSESTERSPRKRSLQSTPETDCSAYGSSQNGASSSQLSAEPCTRTSKRQRTDFRCTSPVNSKQTPQAPDLKCNSEQFKANQRALRFITKRSPAHTGATVDKTVQGQDSCGTRDPDTSATTIPASHSNSDTPDEIAERRNLTAKIEQLRFLEIRLDLWIRSGNGVDRAVWGTSRHPKEMYEQVRVDLEEAIYNLKRSPRRHYLERHGLAAFQARYPSGQPTLPNGRAPLPDGRCISSSWE